jgi:hypothetical protein
LASDAQIKHAKVISVDPCYAETRDWNAVYIPDVNTARPILRFLRDRLGDRPSRFAAGWCHPMCGLFVVRDPVVAIEVKLIFG